MVMNMINVLERITELRESHHWTEYQLAEHSGLTQSTISSWYRKQMLPTIPSLVKICDAFGITDVMQDEVLPLLEKQNFTVLNYEWGTSCITDDDTQFFDGFHLDEKYGLPDWTAELFNDMQR